jgi:uncharacterized protein DUF4190
MSYPQQPGNWNDPSWPSQQTPYQEPVSPYAYPAGHPGYGYAAPVAPTNGMAIASMVVSIVSIVGLICYGGGAVLGVLGAILGHVARRQIRERGENGDGMALAGVVMGWISTAVGLLIIAAFVIFIVWAANQPIDDPTYNQIRALVA